MDIWGVKIDSLPKNEITDRVGHFLAEPKFHRIATINPEFILEAQKNVEFKNILNGCDLNVADGIGIWFAFLRFGKYLKSRIAGIDLMLEILKIADDRGLSVFLAARRDGLSTWEETQDAIHKIYPDLNISGANIPGSLDEPRDDKCNFGDSKIIFVNFGAPHQEIFINSIKSDTLKLAMGVGGSFDFLTGHIRRAPKFIRILGLEWLWRLIQEPKYRWRRIFNSTIIFPWKIIWQKTEK